MAQPNNINYDGNTNKLRNKMVAEMARGKNGGCPSQRGTDFYLTIVRDGRLPRFLAVVQMCSSKGFTIDQTADMIRKVFPNYVTKGFSGQDFNFLTKNIDVSEAWGFGHCGDEINEVMLKSRAHSLAMQGEIGDIKTYYQIYGDLGEDGVSSSGNSTEIIFNLGDD